MSLRRFYASVYDNNLCYLSHFLAMSSRVHLLFSPRGHKLCLPSVAVFARTPASNTVAFQSPVMPNDRTWLCTQSIHYLSFRFARSLSSAPPRSPNTIRFGSRSPLIRMSVPAHGKASPAQGCLNGLTSSYLEGASSKKSSHR